MCSLLQLKLLVCNIKLTRICVFCCNSYDARRSNRTLAVAHYEGAPLVCAPIVRHHRRGSLWGFELDEPECQEQVNFGHSWEITDVHAITPPRALIQLQQSTTTPTATTTMNEKEDKTASKGTFLEEATFVFRLCSFRHLISLDTTFTATHFSTKHAINFFRPLLLQDHGRKRRKNKGFFYFICWTLFFFLSFSCFLLPPQKPTKLDFYILFFFHYYSLYDRPHVY